MNKQIDWQTVQVEVTEQDGHDIWGYIVSATDTNGNDLNDEELQHFEQYHQFYEKLTAQAWGY